MSSSFSKTREVALEREVLKAPADPTSNANRQGFAVHREERDVKQHFWQYSSQCQPNNFHPAQKALAK
jgi:hypothetical protein